MSGGGGSGKIKDTEAQKALASIAAKRFNLYQQFYVPLENQFMSSVFEMTSPESFQNVEGYINALQQPEFQAARRNMQQAAFTSGVDPTSGQYQARGMSQGAAEGLSAQLDRYYQGMQNIIAMGQGQAGQAMAGLGDVGELAQRRAEAAAKQSMSRYESGLGALGTAAGLGYGYGTRNQGSSGGGLGS